MLWAARHHRTGLGALVTVAAATDIDELVDSFRGLTGLGARSRTRLLDRIEEIIGIPRAAFDGPVLAAEVLAEQPEVPLLAVHDSGDAEAPPRVSERLVDVWPGAELVLTDGLGHRRVLWTPEVVTRIADFAGQPVDSRSGSAG